MDEYDDFYNNEIYDNEIEDFGPSVDFSDDGVPSVMEECAQITMEWAQTSILEDMFGILGF